MQVALRIVISFTLLFSFLTDSPAKQADNKMILTRDDISRVIEQLEKRHSVRIHYKPEWFENSEFSEDLANLPLDDAIKELSGDRGLNALWYDHLIVFVPSETVERQIVIIRDNIITIGDPATYGRHNRAIITGRVLDGSTGDPLTGAVVYDEKTKAGVSTDAEGNFSIHLPVGEHMIRVSFVGFEEMVRRVNLLGDGSLDFEVFEKTLAIDEVTIRAKRAEENVARAQMGMITLDSKAIKELPGSYGETDIIKSISLMPGIQTMGEFGTGFHVRGGNSDQNLILIEDVPLFNSSHLFGLTSVVNPDMVNSATLIKAGIPAKYGERASAVMDIRLNNQHYERTGVSGGIGLINSRMLFEAPLIKEKLSFSLGGRASYSDWILREIPDTDLMNSSADFFDIGGTILFSPARNTNISVFGYHSYDGFRLAGTTDFLYTNSLGSIKWNSVFGDKTIMNINAGFSNYYYQVSEPEEINPFEAYELRNSVDYRNLKMNFIYYPTDMHAVEYGFNAAGYDINPGSIRPLGEESHVEDFNLDNEKAVEMSAYISDRITISPQLEAEAGLRYSHFLNIGPVRFFKYLPEKPMETENITDTISFGKNEIALSTGGLEPRINLRYSTGASSSVKVSYNRIHQYINLISNTSVMTPSDIWKLSDMHLHPLRADQYAIGYFINFSDNRIETSVEAYFKDLANITEYRNGAKLMMNETLETDLVNAGGYSYGLELYLNKLAGRLTGWASYTYSVTRLRTTGDFTETRINDNNYFPSNYDRPHNLVINANYNISRRWRLNATFAYNSGRPVTLPELSYSYGGQELVHYSDRNKYRMPDYHRLDIAINFGENLRKNIRGKGSWTLSLINVYGRKNTYSVFYQKDIPNEKNNFRHFSLYKMYIIGRPFPTITYNFNF